MRIKIVLKVGRSYISLESYMVAVLIHYFL